MVLPVNQVLVGDCMDIVKGFPAESIDMVMFSPPYWGLRDYGKDTETVWGGYPECEHEWVEEMSGLVHENRNNLRGPQEEVAGKTGTAWIRKYDQKTVGFCVKCGAWRGQLGLEPNFQMYVAHMVQVCREIKRILKKTGNMYIVLGDTFMKKHKLGIPWRVRFALNEDGWTSRGDIVWHKPNSMPSSVKDRLNTTYEMIFHFVKQKKYYYNLDIIREPHTSLKDLGRKRLDTRTPKHDLAARLGAGNIGPSGYLVQHPLGKNPGDIVQTELVGLDVQGLIREVYHRLSRNGETYEGKNRLEDVNAKRLRAFDGRKIRETARQILKERKIPQSTKLVEFVHDHFCHPLGKNPGDTIHCRTERRLIQDRPLRPPHHPFRGDGWEGINPYMKPHPKGKNPGDVVQEKAWQRAVELHSKRGKLRSNGTIAGHYLDLPEVAKHYNSKGKNPGDIVRIAEEKGRALKPPHHAKRKRASDIDRMVYSGGFYHEIGKNPGDFWSINTKPFKGAHFAVYPEEICVKPILSSCPPNGIVLDPMCGSGTTLAVAKKLGRKYIGIDLNSKYVSIAIDRLLRITPID